MVQSLSCIPTIRIYKVVSLFARLKLGVHPKNAAASRFQKRKLTMKKVYCICSSLVPPPTQLGEFGFKQKICCLESLSQPSEMPSFNACVGKKESLLEGKGGTLRERVLSFIHLFVQKQILLGKTTSQLTIFWSKTLHHQLCLYQSFGGKLLGGCKRDTACTALL